MRFHRALAVFACWISSLLVPQFAETQDISNSITSTQTSQAAPVVRVAAPTAKADEERDFDNAFNALNSNNGIGPSGIIPLQQGFDAVLITTSQHDSAVGWSSVLSSQLAYRFNRHFSLDASVTLFWYIDIISAGGTVAKPVTVHTRRHNVFSDTAVSAHYETPLGEHFAYTFTPTISLPSGNNEFGLGADQITYDFNNHFEANMPFSPFVEFGIGDASSLVNRRIRLNQSSVGILSHFEIGASVDLPYNLAFNASAYEQLPLGDQNIYETTVVKKKPVTRVVGTGLAEDNGFSTTLDIPISAHVTLSGFYNRSLRQTEDTAGFSFTWLMRSRRSQGLLH